MNSFTLDIDHLVKESPNKTMIKFKIESLREEVHQEERSRSKNSHLKARIQSAMKMVSEKSKYFIK